MVPFRLTDSTSSSCAAVISPSGAAGKTPALQHSTSSPPCRSRAAATAAAQLAGSLTSPAAYHTVPPAAVSSAAVRLPSSSSRPVMTTRAPSAAKPAASPLPMPLVPPVTRTDRPLIDVNIQPPPLERSTTPCCQRLRGREQVPLGQLARALGELRAKLAGRVGEPVRADPRDELQPPHEGRDLGRVLGRQRQHATVAAQPGVAEGGHPRVVLDEAQRGADVEEEPAEPAVVEIDDLNVGPADQQVRQPHVGVDQAEPIRPGAEPAQPPGDQVGRPPEGPQLLRADPDAVLPAAPAGRLADTAVEVPGEPDERSRPRPAAGMPVHPRADLAEQLELLGQLVLGRLGPGQPLEQHRLAGDRPDLDVHHLAPVRRPENGRGGQSLVPPQRLQPGELGGDRARLVVAGPVYPQHGSPAVGRVIHAVGRVLREAEQREPGAGGETERAQRGPGERVVAEQDLLGRLGGGRRGLAGCLRAGCLRAGCLRTGSPAAHGRRPSMLPSSRSISSLARPTPALLPAMYTRPDAPIMVTSTSVFSGAACSASLAATAANRAGAISQTSRDWPGSSIDACRDRLITTACWSVTSSITSLYSSRGASWSAAPRPMPSRMAWPAFATSAPSRECTSSTPNWRSTNKIPGSADGAARSARSVTRSIASPGATSMIRA